MGFGLLSRVIDAVYVCHDLVLHALRTAMFGHVLPMQQRSGCGVRQQQPYTSLYACRPTFYRAFLDNVCCAPC